MLHRTLLSQKKVVGWTVVWEDVELVDVDLKTAQKKRVVRESSLDR